MAKHKSGELRCPATALIFNMFWIKNKKIRYTPNIKVGFKGAYIARTCFPDDGVRKSEPAQEKWFSQTIHT